MQLRPYQRECLEAIKRGCNENIVACLPTGAGKSHVIAELIRWATTEFSGTRIAVVTHTRELVQQDYDKILMHLPDADIGIYCAGLGEKDLKQITVASIQSICRNDGGEFEIVIIDESHRIPAGGEGQYKTFLAHHPEARVIGFTATPYRLGGGYIYGEDRLFASLVYTAKTRGLIEQGYLSPIASFGGSKTANLDGVKMSNGDFKLSEMSQRFEDQDIVLAAIEDIIGKAESRSSILVFCCTVKHAEIVRDTLARWLPDDTVAIVTGKTPKAEREVVIEAFKDRRVRILVNCDVLTTGFDAPNVDCVVLLRSTVSPALYVQIVGRGLRKADGKTDCLLLDYGGNVSRHGLIDEIVIRRGSEQSADQYIECPKCREFISASSIKHSCGWIKPRKCWRCQELYDITLSACPACGAERPTHANHEQEAGDVDPITGVGGAVPKGVFHVEYQPHHKEGKPTSMRVIYHVDKPYPFSNKISEWICFEHKGYARRKAVAWCALRGVDDTPTTVHEAIAMAWPKPERIWCRRDGRFWKVIDHEFTEEEIINAAKRNKVIHGLVEKYSEEEIPF